MCYNTCMMKWAIMVVCAALVACGAMGASDELVWHSGFDLPIEGRGFRDTETAYVRLPARFKEKVTPNVWNQSAHPTGLNVRFVTNAKRLVVRWHAADPLKHDPLICSAGESGVSVYGWMDGLGWRFLGTKRYEQCAKAPYDGPAEVTLDWEPNRPGILYLPMRCRTSEFSVGVPKGCTFAAHPYSSGLDRPIVHYGTSIVHGGCAQAHGLAYTSQVARQLDAPYVNLGFSGAGKMEPAMADVLGEIDAALYLVDCVWNMNAALIAERTRPFLRQLRARRPDVPIILCEGCNSRERRLPNNDALRAEYDRLVKEEPAVATGVVYFAEGQMLTKGDYDQTHDFCHPNDIGARKMADAYARKIRATLFAHGFQTPLMRRIAADGHSILMSDLWGGGHRIVFDFNGRKGWLVEPVGPVATGKPWVWTMQWMGAYLERTGAPALVARGWYHAHLEAFDTRASDEGLRALADCQRYLAEGLGLAPKANLIGMSWGGFYSVRYAAAYPQNVAKVFLDAPLLCFRDFYSGKTPEEKAKRIGPWESVPPADGDWWTDPRMPVNMAAALAQAKIPVFLRYGAADTTCVPERNCEPFAERFQAAGGVLTVRKDKMYGHHPHGFEPADLPTILSFFTQPIEP